MEVRRLRRLVVCISGALLCFLGLPAVPAQAAPAVSTPITYIYDEIGRLEAVVNPTAATNGIAKYAYDDVGNLLSITRQSATTTRIIDFHGKTGQVGATVTLYGSSFNTTPSQNQVRFNGSAGTLATVTASTATTLTVTVPSGTPSACTTAPGCVIWAKNLGTSGTATSTQKYLVTGSLTPSITAIVPASADPGTAVTITGTNFDTTSPASNNVFFNGIRAQVTAVTSSTITANVPPFAGPGRVSVQTADGEATSVTDFLTPLVGAPLSDIPRSIIDSATRVTLGQTSSISVSTPGNVALGLVDGQRGHELFIDIPSATTPLYPTVEVFDPMGRLMWSVAFAPTGGSVPTLALPYDGTYAIVFDPQANDTGQMNITPVDATHTTTTITPGGAAVPFSTSVMGQNARFTFSGTVGQRVSALITSTTYPCCPWLRLIDPTGRDVGGAVQSAGPGYNAFLEPQTLTWAGTHYLEWDPSNKDVGSATIQLYDVLPDPNYPISIGGGVVTGSNSVPGQNFTLPFSGTSGQKVSLAMTGGNISCCVANTVKFLRPDGTQLYSGSDVPPGSGSTGTITLDQTGTYTILYDLVATIVGTRNFQLSLVPGFAGPRPFDLNADPSASATGDGAIQPHVPTALRTELAAYAPTTPEAWAPAAPSGGRALAGEALKLDGTPLPGATVRMGTSSATTDETGRFLLTDIEQGDQVLTVDGSTANSTEATYGSYEMRVTIRRHGITTLPWTIWMTKLDISTTVQVPNTLTHEVVLQTPAIPGLEVHIPKGSSLTDEDGDPVNELSITPVPIDRPPFPLPPFGFPMYFTVQPGGTYVSGKGAWVVYPNTQDRPPGIQVPLMHYDPDGKGWYVYGHGRMSPDGKRIVPDRQSRIWSFTGGGYLAGTVGAVLSAPCTIPNLVTGAGTSASGGSAEEFVGNTEAPNYQPYSYGGSTYLPTIPNCGGDPVDLSNGLFAHGETDLHEGGLPAFDLTRNYRQNDSITYSFGVGTGTQQEMFLYTTDAQASIDLAIPGERTIHFTKTGGTTQADTVYEAQTTPGPFTKARMYFVSGNGGVYYGGPSGWSVHLRDGSSLFFGPVGALSAIVDRFGNQIRMIRAVGSALTGIIGSPSGRWISLTRTSGLVSSAVDSAGRTVNYTYENPATGLWRLKTITFPVQSGLQTARTTTLTWDPSTVVNTNPSATPSPGTYLDTIVDARGNTVISNHFDAQGRIDQQTVAGGGQYTTDYTGGSQCPGKTKLTDPNGNIRCVGFDAGGFASSSIEAVGTADQRTFTSQLDPTTHRVTSTTDSFHNRTTSYTYDPTGNVKTVARLDGTGSAETTTYDWNSLAELKSVTDPLSHATTFGYDLAGCLTSITDASTNQTTFTCNAAGQVTTSVYPGSAPVAQRTTTLTYAHGDLVSTTDPLGRVSRRFTDAAGRLLSATDPLGYRTRMAYDVPGDLLSLTDARGKTTAFTYDQDSNLTRITDALTNQTNFTYFSTNLLQTKTDALTRSESYAYDLKGNLILRTDRKNQVTEYRYNAYDRPTFIGYKRQGSPGSYTYESTLTLGYDGGWRLTSVADNTTGAGTISRGYDDLDRLVSDQQPQGTTTYTYWSDDRRKTMTAGNQAVTNYSYFANGLLQQISQGSATIGLTYLPNHLPSTTTLAGGQVETYSFDGANELTAIAYSGTGVPASSQITYGYDPNGKRTGVWDSYARVGLPTAMAGPAVYNADNQLTSWNATANTYDLNGNLTAAGAQTYTWNARDQLTATSGGTSSFIYDGLGRRIKKVVSGTTTKFLYDGLNPVQEQNNAGTVTGNLITGLGLDQTYQRTTGGTSYNFLTDVLGSTVALVAGTAVSNEFTYQPYGATTQTGSGTHPFRFTGREWDGAAGLQFNRARYYNPTWGRFVSEDPIGYLGSGVNAYGYVFDHPTTATDPLGLDDGHGCGILGIRCAFRYIWNDPLRFLKDVFNCVYGAAETFAALFPIDSFGPVAIGAALGGGCAGGVASYEGTR